MRGERQAGSVRPLRSTPWSVQHPELRTGSGTGNRTMATLFDGTNGTDDIGEILDRMEVNCPCPSSDSRKLWQLRRATYISGHSRRKETMLEKAVAMLARNGHMPGWFNQCPAASGIGDSSRNKHSNVDLVHWRTTDKHALLVELKWDSDSPFQAVRQILRYGAAYFFCRRHRDRLPVRNRRVMSARQVSLRVAAPARYYADANLRRCLSRARESLQTLSSEPGMRGLSISLDVLAFPQWFDRLPFTNGAEVRKYCDRQRLTDAGQEIVDAFEGLTSVRPGPGGKRV